MLQRIAHLRLSRVRGSDLGSKNPSSRLAVCLIEVISIAAKTQAAAYNVNVRQGELDGVQRESSLFVSPIADLEKAKLRAVHFAQAKLMQGWQLVEENGLSLASVPQESAAAASKSSLTPSQTSPAIQALIRRFSPDNWKLLSSTRHSRSVWRVGELCGAGYDAALRGLAPHLVSLLETGDDMLDYCIAFSLGRLGDAGACEAMSALKVRGRSEATRRIARQAWLALGGAVEDALSLNEATIEQAYDLALAQPQARLQVLESVRALSFAPGSFKAFRAIYKNAEFRRDYELLALLHARIESTPGNARSVAYTSASAKKRNTYPTYAQTTRHYLQLRGWRVLRRLVAMAHPDAVSWATELLLALNDSDLPEPCEESAYIYVDGHYSKTTRYYSSYAKWMLVRKLLLTKHPAMRGAETATRWWTTQALNPHALPIDRYEQFTAMWNHHPQALLRLLIHSRAAIVHGFAVRALQDNPSYLQSLDDTVLATLLHSDYALTADLGFDITRSKIEGASSINDKAHWLCMLVQSRSQKARQFVQQQVPLQLSAYGLQPHLMAALLTCEASELRQLGASMAVLTAQNQAASSQLLALALDWLEAADADLPAYQSIVEILQSTILGPLAAHAAQAPAERLRSMLLQAEVPAARLAFEWLKLTPAGLKSVDAAMFKQLLSAQEAGRRALGVALLATLSDAVLHEQADLLAHYALSEDAEIRNAARAPVLRLVNADSAFADRIARALADQLFRAETAEGQHASILQWLQEDFVNQAKTWDANICWRATQAASRGAQRLGAWLLTFQTQHAWSPKQLATWARNAELSVRQFSVNSLAAMPGSTWAEVAGDTLPLFDTGFEDAREFAQQHFTRTLMDIDFQASFLVALVDHPKAWVQALGRELIGRRLDDDSALEYLLKLSQHPSQDVQLFVTNWLTRAEGVTPEETAQHLARLRPYFVAVLSQVNRARIAKTRVLAFLHQQTAYAATAQVVADIYARQVVTASLKDKPAIIAGLREIAVRHPSIVLPFMQTNLGQELAAIGSAA